MVLRIATSRDDIEVVAVNDPFIDAKYMVRKQRETIYFNISNFRVWTFLLTSMHWLNVLHAFFF